MGILSSIWRSIKSVLNSVLSSVARVFGKIFGSPIVAALAVFIIAWVVTGVPLADFLSAPTTLLTSGAFLAAATINVVFAVAMTFFPELTQVLGRIMGFISFVIFAATVWMVWTTGVFTNLPMFIASRFGSFGMTLDTFTYWYSVVVWFSYANFVTGAAADPDTYAAAWTGGFTAVPGVVVEVADAVLDGVAAAARTALLPTILLGFGIYMGAKYLMARSERIQLEVKREVPSY